MKNYYVSCAVRFTDLNNGEPSNDIEFYSSIIASKLKRTAKNKAKKEALKIFNADFNNGFENIHVEVEECYAITSNGNTY